jgi:hypothetical protein
MIELPVALSQSGLDGACVRRIDRGGFPARGIVQQYAVIIRQARNESNIEGSHVRSLVKRTLPVKRNEPTQQSAGFPPAVSGGPDRLEKCGQRLSAKPGANEIFDYYVA